jgi:DNA (cytosine-5)-methyltransferase 1
MTQSSNIDVLNLYAGIGGNRKNWSNVNVTAIEWDKEKAEIYQDHFPNDEIIITDAHEYLKENHNDYDFIWTSPPCPTHSQIRYLAAGEDKQNDAVFPNMKLYEEILFLQGYYDGDYVVENVNGWYDPLIEPQERQRHYFWSNFHIPSIELEASNIYKGTIDEWESKLGYDLSGYGVSHNKKRKMLRNCVKPKLGEHIMKSRDTSKQQGIETFLSD